MKSTPLLCLLLCAPSLNAQEPGAVPITGRVVDWQGRPIAGAGVLLAPERDIVTRTALRKGTAQTDADGRFQVTWQAAGVGELWLLHVAARGKASIELPLNSVGPPRQPLSESRDLGELVLADGVNLIGRVRDPDGKPLPGVRVTARDMLADSRFLRDARSSTAFVCRALSDASGIFSLPCALPLGVRLELFKDGHYHVTLEPVSRQTPLEVTLQPSGWIQGRVLDPEGRGLQTSIQVTYEHAGFVAPIRSEPDGSFRATLAYPVRYRLSIAPPDEGLQGKETGALSGPQEQLEIQLEVAEVATGPMLKVHAVAKATGAPIADFAAASVWDENANQNANYLEYLLQRTMRTSQAAVAGVASVRGPSPKQPTAGVVRVVAEGYAPATLSEVGWPEDDPDPRVTAELVAESTLRGVVRDEASGAPIAGARVWLEKVQDPALGIFDGAGSRVPDTAVATGAGGSFHLRGLGQGSYRLRVRYQQRPQPEPKALEIGAAEQKTGVEISVPPGAPVAGKLVGVPIGPGWKVRLVPLATPQRQAYATTTLRAGPHEAEAVAAAADGTFVFAGVELGNYMLMLDLPSRPRHGAAMQIPIEPFRVRHKGIDRPFDVHEDQPGVIRGRIALRGASIPFDHLVVIAQPHRQANRMFFSPLNANYSGPRSFVNPSGDFEIRVGPGRHAIQIVDFTTGILLLRDTEPLDIKASGTGQRDLDVNCVAVGVKLVPEEEDGRIVADRLEVRVTPKARKAAGRAVFGGDMSTYDTGVGIRLLPGQREATVVVPPGDIAFYVRGGTGRLLRGRSRNQAPLGEAELDTADVRDGRGEVEITVAPPPEIEDQEGPRRDDGDVEIRIR